MDKRKILLVSNGFFPEISPRSFRATELAKEFLRQGHLVKVISKNRQYNYSDFLNEYPIKLEMWKKPKFPSFPDVKFKPLSNIFRVLARLFSVFLEYPGIEEMFLVKKALKNESGYDLVISFAVPYPVHWGVALARSKRHRIGDFWIADCGDPYMGDVLDSFKKPYYFKYLETSFSKKADYISIPVESARNAYYPEFHHKIVVIPQGFDFNMSNTVKDRLTNPCPKFAYAGGFLTGIRDPSMLIQCLREEDMPFEFHVYTKQQELFHEHMKTFNGKLFVSDYIPREDLLKKLSEMDFLLNFDNNTPLNIPSKLIDYAILNLPVLNIDAGFTCNTLKAFLAGDYTNKMQLPDPARYHIKNVSKSFLDLF